MRACVWLAVAFFAVSGAAQEGDRLEDLDDAPPLPPAEQPDAGDAAEPPADDGEDEEEGAAAGEGLSAPTPAPTAQPPAAGPAPGTPVAPPPPTEAPTPPPAPAPAATAVPTLPVPVDIPPPGEANPPIPELPELPPPGTSAYSRPDYGWLDYLVWYGPEWAIAAGSGAFFLAGGWLELRPLPALIGPAFDENDPDLGVLHDDRLTSLVGRPLMRQQVSGTAATLTMLSALTAAGVVDGVHHMDFHHTHSLVLGGLTALTASVTFSEAAKLLFGRLRPDFRDRYARASCSGVVPDRGLYDCDAVLAEGGEIDRREWNDGFKAFPSGHAATSFAMATYLSLHIGAEWVWAEDAGALSPIFGSLAMGALYSGALYTSATRVEDNRHHLDDIAVGAGLGAAIGAASYFLHFDLDGNAHYRGLELTPGPGAAGLALAGTF